MKEMLPPQTWTDSVTRDGGTQSNITLTNTPLEYTEDDEAELSDTEQFVTRIWQLMQRVSRETALGEPYDMNDQT